MSLTGDEEVTWQGLAWVSQRKGLPTSTDDTEVDFANSPEWQAYLTRFRPDDWCVMMIVDDRKHFRVRQRVLPDGIDIVASVPADYFLGDEAKQDVYRDIKLRTYSWISEKFGWPPPPPLPPLTVKRTYRKNFQPPKPTNGE